MNPVSQRLENLKKKQEQIKSQIQSLEASQKSRERKKETRRKILVGAYFLEMARAENSYEDIVKKMDAYLARDSDRVLFDLQPKK